LKFSVYINPLIALVFSLPQLQPQPFLQPYALKLEIRLFLSLLLPLLPVLILASEPDTSLTLLRRQNDGCSLLPIITENSFLHSCGTPGWGVPVDCTCCGPDLACVDTIQTCGTVDGVYVCLNNVYPAPLMTTETPAAPKTSSSPAFTESYTQSSFRTTTALGTSAATAAAVTHTSSNGPSVGSVGTSAASKSLQRADIVGVIFVTGLLLAFGNALK
jgi:hypothetical protein